MVRAALALAIHLGSSAYALAAAPSWPTPPAWWMVGARCVHEHESRDWHIHNPPYANGFQFMLGTWVGAGGSAATWITSSPAEQFYRTFIVYERDLHSGNRWGWREWPNTSRVCGLGR